MYNQAPKCIEKQRIQHTSLRRDHRVVLNYNSDYPNAPLYYTNGYRLIFKCFSDGRIGARSAVRDPSAAARDPFGLTETRGRLMYAE